jgi:hypothetical protein
MEIGALVLRRIWAQSRGVFTSIVTKSNRPVTRAVFRVKWTFAALGIRAFGRRVSPVALLLREKMDLLSLISQTSWRESSVCAWLSH